MKIGRTVSTAVATHAALTIGSNGGVHTGDINLGANRLKTTNAWIVTSIADELKLVRTDGVTVANLFMNNLRFEGQLLSTQDGRYLAAKDVNAGWLGFKARDTDGALTEVARLQGAASPYFQMSLPMVLKPAGIPGTLVKGHFAYVADDDKLAFYDGAAAQFIASNLIGAFAVFRFTCTTIIATNITKYLSPGSADASETEDTILQIVVPVAGTLKNLYIKTSRDPGAGHSFIYTVRINGVDKTLTATVADTATTASDTVHSEAVAVGDLVSVKVVTDDGAAVHYPVVSLGLA